MTALGSESRETAADPRLRPFGGHVGVTGSVAFSPDGAILASGGSDYLVRLWDPRTGEQRAELSGHAGQVLSVAFSPDGRLLASGGLDAVRVWDVATGEQRLQLSAPGDSVAFSPDGVWLASAGATADDAIVVLWEVATGTERHALKAGRHSWARAVAFSPDGLVLASGADNHEIRLWDARAMRQVGRLVAENSVSSLAWNPDSTVLASSSGGLVELWDPRSRERRIVLDVPGGRVRSVAFSPGGARLATAGNDGRVRLWDPRDGKAHVALEVVDGPVRAVAFSPDGPTLASGAAGPLRLWDLGNGALRAVLAGHAGQMRAVAFSPDGAVLATGGEDGSARLWDVRTGEQRAVLSGDDGPVRAVAFSPDGAVLATGGENGPARLWDVRTGEQRVVLPGHDGQVLSVAFNPDGTTLASGDSRGVVRLWDPGSGAERAVLSGHIGHVLSVAFSPDGRTLASGGGDGQLVLWDTRDKLERERLSGAMGAVYAVAFSPGGAVLASGAASGGIRLWDARSGEPLAVLEVHAGYVRSVAFSPDGRLLASGGADGLVRVWDPNSGEQRAELAGHTGQVWSVAFSPDGAALASVGDHTIRLWNPRSGVQINVADAAAWRYTRPLAGVRNDSPSAEDLIGVGADVEMLADLIAAAQTRPPLAIAIVGDWGSGKSSVMLQVEQRINLLAGMSRNNPGLSAFTASVRQVRFNAWHYSDEQLWSGLVSHIFRTLAEPGEPAGGPQPDASDLQAERAGLQARLADRQGEERRLASELSAADQLARPAGFLAWLGSPRYLARIIAIAARATIRDVRASITILLGWAVLAAAALAVWYRFGTVAGTVVSVACAVVAPVLFKLRVMRSAVTRFTEWQRQRLDARRRQNQREIGAIQERLCVVDAAFRLSAFLGERGAPGAYQEYRGLLGQVHDDLTRLAADLAAARTQWITDRRATPPPLERIVLYVDDLDRCPPRQVVEVLEAVHLMLAMELFVVVVAVDARWLIRSLEYHHRELFRMDEQTDGVEGPATPLDYLDKIFQIPYTLLPPQSAAAGSYLRALLPSAQPQPGAAADGTAGGGGPVGSPPTGTRGAAVDASGAAEDATGAAGDAPGAAEDATGAAGTPAPEDGPGAGPAVGAGFPSTEDESRAAASLAEGGTDGPPDLRPEGLRLTSAEIDFMARLGAFVPTPRAAKRLVNLYRLVRIGIPDTELAAFAGGGSYQVVQLLLAVLCGSGTTAREMFQVILASPGDAELPAVLADPGTSHARRDAFGRISAQLERIGATAPLPTRVGDYQEWCPALARYSFYTRDLAGPPPDWLRR